MSLERLKKYSERFALISKILYIAILLLIICQTISFVWQALMPNKLNGFFDIFRIYAPFISNIDNNSLCLYELSILIFNNLFLFVILLNLNKLFGKFTLSLSLEAITPEIKKLSLILIAESAIMPIMKNVCYSVFIKLHVPTGSFDFCPLVIGALLYFVAIVIESKSVIKEKEM